MTCKFQEGRFYRNSDGLLLKIVSTSATKKYAGMKQPICAARCDNGIKSYYTSDGYYGSREREFTGMNLIPFPVMPTADEMSDYGISLSEIQQDETARHDDTLTAVIRLSEIRKAVDLSVSGNLKNLSGNPERHAIDEIINQIAAMLTSILSAGERTREKT